MRDWVFPMDLQLFAEGGAASGDGGEGTGVSAPAAGVQTKGAKSNPLANVLYGKQPQAQPQESAPAAGVQPESTQETPPDRHAEFEKMIKGDYKEAADKWVQNIIRQRLKGSQETENRLKAMDPILDHLSARYGKEATDIEGITKAMQADDDLLEKAAMDQGYDPKNFRKMMQMKSENARMKAREADLLRQQQLDQQYAKWEQQAQEARAIYPSLDLNVESQNPQFRQLLLAGVDVGSAYKVIHMDEVVTGAMQQGVQKGKESLASTIAAGKARPAENGASAQSAAVIKSDPSKWTKADRQEVIRRAARGERIEL